MPMIHGGVKVSFRDTILAPERWILIHDGDVLAGGYFTEGETLSVFPPCELAIHPMADRRLKRELLPGSRGVKFTYGKDGYRPQSTQRARCSDWLRTNGQSYPRTCMVCGLGPCRFKTPEDAESAGSRPPLRCDDPQRSAPSGPEEPSE